MNSVLRKKIDVTAWMISHVFYYYNKIKFKNVAKPFKVIFVDPNDIKLCIEASQDVKKGYYRVCGIIKQDSWGPDVKIQLPSRIDALESVFKKWFVKKEKPEDLTYFKKRPERLKLFRNKKYLEIFNKFERRGMTAVKPINQKHDPFFVSIDADGGILFMTGKHRLALAKAAGLKKIPVFVSRRHILWQKIRESYLESPDSVPEHLRQHPDLNY